jgi:hypothetical protein
MPSPSQKVRVLIPTTNGPVEVLLLTEEDAAIGRCVACIGGTTETADIAAAYHAFVVRPTGVIESLFGHSCYRLDVSGRIDAGSSWQLGVLAAHGLHAAGRLAQENDPADGVIWATGSVRPVDLTVGGVSHLPEKLAHSMDRLKQEVATGRRVTLAIPQQNAANVPVTLRTELATLGIELLELSQVTRLFDALALKPPEARPKTSTTPGPIAEPKVSATVSRRYVWASAAAVLLCVAGAMAYLMTRSLPVKEKPESPPSPVIRSEARMLVPELVPFISDNERARLREVYMAAPDYKALAIGPVNVSFVTAQPDKATAQAAALNVCQQIADRQRDRIGAPRTDCELYAVGNEVVSNRGYPPMPVPPWLVRDPAVEVPFELGRAAADGTPTAFHQALRRLAQAPGTGDVGDRSLW